MTNNPRFGVIGAGHGGKAMAAHLAVKGFEVGLFNRTYENIAAIEKRNGIELESYEGGPHGFAELQLVTSDYKTFLDFADMVMIVVPSSAHAQIAEKCAPYIKDGQIVVLHPGRTCGALEFRKVLKDNGCVADVIISEAETFIYASRSDGPAQARIFRIKDAVSLAALPAIHTPQVLETIQMAYPQFIDGIDVLHTGLNNMGAIFHPAITLLNTGWVEASRGDFQFYIDGVTPSVARILEVLDRERVTVASSLGLRARTAMEWLKMAYNATGEDLYEAIHNQEGYYGIKAPISLTHRYIFEDIPMSLVPILALARRYGVSARGMESIIRIGNFVHRTDYWRRGRTLDKLGIERFSVSELIAYVREDAKH